MSRSSKQVQLRINVSSELADKIVRMAEFTGQDQSDVIRTALQFGLRAMWTPPATQTALARQIGISQPHLSRILAGKCQPSFPIAEAVAKALNVHVMHILSPAQYDREGNRLPGDPDGQGE